MLAPGPTGAKKTANVPREHGPRFVTVALAHSAESVPVVNPFEAFGGVVVAAAAWTIWGTELFPRQPDPTGDPETWTRAEMRRWLAAVGLGHDFVLLELLAGASLYLFISSFFPLSSPSIFSPRMLTYAAQPVPPGKRLEGAAAGEDSGKHAHSPEMSVNIGLVN